jgi:hypothetical protein
VYFGLCILILTGAGVDSHSFRFTALVMRATPVDDDDDEDDNGGCSRDFPAALQEVGVGAMTRAIDGMGIS